MKEQFNDDINSLQGRAVPTAEENRRPSMKALRMLLTGIGIGNLRCARWGLLKRPNALSPWAPMIWRR